MIRASRPIPQATAKMRSCRRGVAGRGRPARPAEVDDARVTVADGLDARPDAADPERGREHVAGPRGHDRHRRRATDERGRGLADRAVAADDHDELCLGRLGERGPGRLERLHLDPRLPPEPVAGPRR